MHTSGVYMVDGQPDRGDNQILTATKKNLVVVISHFCLLFHTLIENYNDFYYFPIYLIN